MIKSATRKMTAMGVPQERTEYRLVKGATRRVNVTHWLAKAVGQDVEHEAGTVVLLLQVGQNLKTKNLAKVVLAPADATPERIEAEAAALLG
jgi:hypothetical protein